MMRTHVQIKTAENGGVKREKIRAVFVEIIPYEMRLSFLVLLPLREPRDVYVCVCRCMYVCYT